MYSKYRLADIDILFKTEFDFEPDKRFEPFRASFDEPELTFEFTLSDHLEKPDAELVYSERYLDIFRNGGVTFRCFSFSSDENRKYAAIVSDELKNDHIFKVAIKKNSLCHSLPEIRLFDRLGIEHAMALFGGALLHSAFIIHNGEAILFSAPSGTGKSTQAQLWKENMGSTIANGDRSLLRIGKDAIMAYSLPYCGTSNISLNTCAPLKTIVILRQAPYNKLSRLCPAEAFRHIYSECAIDIWYDNDVRVICDVIESIIQRVPVLMLECLPDADAVHILAEALNIEH